MKIITLLIPVYNEESVLSQLFRRLDEFTKKHTQLSIRISLHK